MKRSSAPSGRTGDGRATVLAGLILLQVLCALFFIGDVAADLRSGVRVTDLHLFPEALAALALVAGIVYLTVELRALLDRIGEMDRGLKAARGQMAEVIDTFFDAWALTQAERDVAVMILKGIDNETIARLRRTAPGTVRAQATAIYAKSASQGRAQFISLFMEELLSGDFGAKPTPAPPVMAEARRDTAHPM